MVYSYWYFISSIYWDYIQDNVIIQKAMENGLFIDDLAIYGPFLLSSNWDYYIILLGFFEN